MTADRSAGAQASAATAAPTSVIGGVGPVVRMPLGTMGWARQPSVADPGQLAGSAHLPVAVPIGVGRFVRMSRRALTSRFRPRSTLNPNIDRRASFRVICIRDQASKFLLGSPAPDAMLLASGDGVRQALDLDGATVTDGQRLVLSRGGQAGCCPAVPAQLVQVGREEDVLVGRRHDAPTGSEVHPRAEPAATVGHGASHLVRRERAEARAKRVMWARRACMARRRRSSGVRRPSGSTWRSNLARSAAWPLIAAFRDPCLACIS